MVLIVILGLLIILLISFILALRSLSELQVPQEILLKIKQGQSPPKFWGMIIFLKGKILHYYSSSSSKEVSSNSSLSDSSKNSSTSSDRIEA